MATAIEWVLILAIVGLLLVVGYFVVMAVVFFAAVPLAFITTGVAYVLAGIAHVVRYLWTRLERRVPRIASARRRLVTTLTPTPAFMATMRRSRSIAHPWSGNP